jgi:hypothetical protein
MQCGARLVVICLLAGVAVGAQGGQKTGPASPQGQPQQPEERPTLGPRSGPGLESGPDTSTTTDFRKLVRIHTLYIESIDNSLSDKLIDTIGKWGRFRLVTKAKDADATLRGSCLESRRLKHVHSEVFISDRSGASIWQDTIYRPFNPPALDQAVSDTATLVEAHLAKAVQEGMTR